MVTLGEVFLSEFAGTAVLILLGCGVVANVALRKTKGNGGGTLMVNFGWGLGVFAGVFAGGTECALALMADVSAFVVESAGVPVPPSASDMGKSPLELATE